MTTEQRLEQLEDRIAIRELIDAYTFCADTRDIQGHMALFTDDTNFEVYMDEKVPEPTQVITGRKNLFPAFDNLNQYFSTMHFNGQSTVTWEQDAATGVSYCLAHHVKVDGQSRSLMIASIRYLDQFVKMDGHWYFRQRKLMVDWIDNRRLEA